MRLTGPPLQIHARYGALILALCLPACISDERSHDGRLDEPLRDTATTASTPDPSPIEPASPSSLGWTHGRFLPTIDHSAELLDVERVLSFDELNPDDRPVSRELREQLRAILPDMKRTLLETHEATTRAGFRVLRLLGQESKLLPEDSFPLTADLQAEIAAEASRIADRHARHGDSPLTNEQCAASARRVVLMDHFDLTAQTRSPSGQVVYATRTQVLEGTKTERDASDRAKLEAVTTLTAVFVQSGLLDSQRAEALRVEMSRHLADVYSRKQ